MATQLLIIEDDTQIRENLLEMLSLHGFEVMSATNGREGISQALLHPPDLILCDIMMPEVDGYQVLEVVRANRRIAHVPFIFLTAKTEPTDLRRGMEQGADDYLTKPFTLQHLLRTVESRLQREVHRKAQLKTQLDSYRHNLASVAVHEYNTALTGIIGFSSLLIESYGSFPETEAVSLLGMIKVCGLRLKRSLDNIQLMDVLQRLTPTDAAYETYCGGNSELSPDLVMSWIQLVLQRLDRVIDYELVVAPGWVNLSAANLQICVVELLDNAFKFSLTGSKILIGGEPDGVGYRFWVTNQGQPFPEEAQFQIGPYRQFNRQRYEQQGFGLGLALVQHLVSLNQGRLEVMSPADGKTTVSIWLPSPVA